MLRLKYKTSSGETELRNKSTGSCKLSYVFDVTATWAGTCQLYVF